MKEITNSATVTHIRLFYSTNLSLYSEVVNGLIF